MVVPTVVPVSTEKRAMKVPLRRLGVSLPRVALVFLLLALTYPGTSFGGQLSLTWADTSPTALGFSIERSIGISGPFTVLATTAAGVTSYTDDMAAEYTIYCYRIRAFNAVGYSDYSAPACGSTTPTAVSLSLTLNQLAFALGERFRLDITVAGGPLGAVDVYVGSLLPSGSALGCPDGNAVAYVVDRFAGLSGGLVIRCLAAGPSDAAPLYRNASIPASTITVEDLFAFVWPDTVGGDYTIFVFLTHPGTADVIALGIATISYTP